MLLQRFEANPNPQVADRVARFCLLFPNSMDDLRPAARLAERALAKRAEDPSIPLGELAAALVDYRTERFAEADQRLGRLLARDDTKSNRHVLASVSLFQAMAQHQLGQHDLARRTLANVDQLVGSDLDSLAKGPVPGDWDDLVILAIVHDEARSLIAPNPKASSPARAKKP